MSLSIVNYYGKQNSRCGYCKNLDEARAAGMHAYNLCPQDYQDLIDRGWRRSGLYCYKPDNKSTCCPCYTIRCDAMDFQMAKSHKKVLKRMNRFLRDGKKDKSEELVASRSSVVGDDVEYGGTDLEPKAPNVPIQNVCLDAVVAANPQRQADARLKFGEIGDVQTMIETPPKIVHTPEALDDSQNPPRKKAKQIRVERRQAKLAAKGLTIDSTMAPANLGKKPEEKHEKTLSDYFSDAKPDDKHTLKIVTVPSSKQHASEEAFNLYRKYQLTIHNDNPQRVNLAGLQRFLYNTPLKHTKTHGGPAVGYGSFHQQYWLDDQLIAVGVIDILPFCVSSVYFFYDPEYSFLSLGTYGSLREIEYVRKLTQNVPALKYYYMGFYIHSCPKMRYKGKLVPSYLLCPETYSWQLLTEGVRNKLDELKYVRLNVDSLAKDTDEFLETHLDLVLLLVENNRCINYREYIQSFNIETLDNMLDIIKSRIYKKITGEEDDRDSILEYGKLVGKTCAHRMLYLKI